MASNIPSQSKKNADRVITIKPKDNEVMLTTSRDLSKFELFLNNIRYSGRPREIGTKISMGSASMAFTKSLSGNKRENIFTIKKYKTIDIKAIFNFR